MRNLVINKNSCQTRDNSIEYKITNTVYLNSKLIYEFTTPYQHGLKTGDEVKLLKIFTDVYDDKGRLIEGNFTNRFLNNKYIIPTEKKTKITVIDEKKFTITFDEYVLIPVENYAEQGGNAILHIDHNIDIIPQELVNDVQNFVIKSGGIEYIGRSGAVYNSDGSMTNPEDASVEMIVFDKPLNNVPQNGYVYVKNTWHIKDAIDSIEFDSTNIKIYVETAYLTADISLLENTEYNIYDRSEQITQYLDSVKYDILPEVYDNEKRQFNPATYVKLDGFERYDLASEIKFNIHLIRRENLELSNSFKTTDDEVWNNYNLDINGKLITDRKNIPNRVNVDDLGDELSQIGFTEDDIKYQKNKLKKTFLRLSFYSSKELMNRELLAYATIFLNSNDIYRKYSNIITKFGKDKIFDTSQADENFRLSTSFSVKNKFNTRTSSEGFYLYLFPNEVNESEERTIYMKVEFNHAGYGKTIPLMLPRSKKQGLNDIEVPLSTLSTKNTQNNLVTTNFPLTFVVCDENGLYDNDIEGLTDATMIPVKIKYEKTLKSYIYYFPWFQRTNEDKITINLWEPRIRGI